MNRAHGTTPLVASAAGRHTKQFDWIAKVPAEPLWQNKRPIAVSYSDRDFAAGSKPIAINTWQEKQRQWDGISLPPGVTLAIRCFGALRVLRNGRLIEEHEWESWRAKLLLAFLLHNPEGSTKSRLLEALYGARVTTMASLHMNLRRLRHALEPGLGNRQGSRYVSHSEGLYIFAAKTGIWLDTWTFELAFRPLPEVTREEEIAQLRKALALYRGDFLPEFEEEWVITLRQRFRDRALLACRRLLALTGDRDPQSAIEIVYRALEIDPLAEDFHRELILRFIERGEPHRALEHFRLCERRFQEQLGMSPPADLAALVAAL
ncbi:MAG: hypothetical protein HY692_05750 [Cyanobacteria bacterium NC_groundwater_1444_Ag_S-0.65um_54_12]|nr:hypothetical protein [Cyanobacteria bacterium NC_groundwater_1444_Ag_S-0.65um_54_12]